MSLQIFILGLLHKGDYHPYDVKKRILQGTNNAVNVTDGNLYYNFEALLKKEFIQKSQIIQAENRPDKITYSITPKGREAFKEEIYKSFKNAKSIRTLLPVLPFLEYVDAKKLFFYVEDVLERLNNRAKEFEEKGLATEIDPVNPDYKILIGEVVTESIKLEIQMFNKLLLVLKTRLSSPWL
ncbi:PadR family transcriptional regulator [Paenibacillus macerans]|uniref:PadR family transcriptional regulator n=1 Tax=Paenibacillus macerans TaxID=44252 RepID=UPI001F0F41FE|nr:PadR family transcriptional regulator [Paenibacillus macerans]MBS5915107.1 PadR family transcriptional regulator [Paenibacillus macerans]UMV48109.1 PadR family transcriptional regulator [Paenibacillus macerans]